MTLLRILPIAIILAFVACQKDPGPSAPLAPGKDAAAAISLVDVTYAQLDAKVAAEKGKVVIVDVWATSCPPCVKRFPHFGKLHEQLAAEGLVCISVSTDDKDDAKLALEFLKEQKAAFANYRFAESNAKISKELNEKYPTDEEPVMFVFNRKGEKVKQYTEKNGFEEIEAELRKLLAEK